jgi:hypothetical protein
MYSTPEYLSAFPKFDIAAPTIIPTTEDHKRKNTFYYSSPVKEMKPTVKPVSVLTKGMMWSAGTSSNEYDDAMDGSIARLHTSGITTHTRRHVAGMEESWNGLFAFESLDASTSNMLSSTASSFSAKKKGHTSFTDLGLYIDVATKHGNGSATSVLPKCIEEETKAQFMKQLRLNRMRRPKSKPTTTRPSMAAERLHQSDSALLRKDSEMDTSDLDGAWYRAKHPRYCQVLEKMAHSTGSLVS